MTGRKLMLLTALAFGVAAASANALSATGPSAESDSVVEGSRIHQEINMLGSDIHYWIQVRNVEGAPPFCATLQLERKRDGRWEPLRIDAGQHQGVSECCPQPKPDEACGSSDKVSSWDLFVYPTKRNSRRLLAGKLRVRGSTDLGPSLVLRP